MNTGFEDLERLLNYSFCMLSSWGEIILSVEERIIILRNEIEFDFLLSLKKVCLLGGKLFSGRSLFLQRIFPSASDLREGRDMERGKQKERKQERKAVKERKKCWREER